MKRVTKAVWYTEDNESFTRKTEALAHETRLELVEMATAVLADERMGKAIGNEIADHWQEWLEVLQLRARRIRADVKVLGKAAEDF